MCNLKRGLVISVEIIFKITENLTIGQKNVPEMTFV
jgi:hypothetical protein